MDIPSSPSGSEGLDDVEILGLGETLSDELVDVFLGGNDVAFGDLSDENEISEKSTDDNRELDVEC